MPQFPCPPTPDDPHVNPVRDLEGVCLLVTRPRGRGESLCRAVEARGGRVERLPLLDIEAADPDAALVDRIDGIDRYDIAIFVSVNAVEHGSDLLARRGVALRADTVVAAVGPGSAEALSQRGFDRVVVPAGRSNSEELLECEALKQVAGRRVVIFRGQDGREAIADTLSQRGAEVSYANVYRRVPSTVDMAPVISRWLAAARPVLLLTSQAAAQVLLRRVAVTERVAVLTAPLVVLSERLARCCRSCGWRGEVAVASSTNDEALLVAVTGVATPRGANA